MSGKKIFVLPALAVAVSIASAAWAEQSDTQKTDQPPKPRHEKFVFEALDQNKDGEISVEEHEIALEKSMERRRDRFRKMDADGNGSVSQEEAHKARQYRKDKRSDRGEKGRPRPER